MCEHNRDIIFAFLRHISSSKDRDQTNVCTFKCFIDPGGMSIKDPLQRKDVRRTLKQMQMLGSHRDLCRRDKIPCRYPSTRLQDG